MLGRGGILFWLLKKIITYYIYVEKPKEAKNKIQYASTYENCIQEVES